MVAARVSALGNAPLASDGPRTRCSTVTITECASIGDVGGVLLKESAMTASCYRCRAECANDVERFLLHLQHLGVPPIDSSLMECEALRPDVVWSFESALPHRVLQVLMRDARQDWHVMAETLQPQELYTGNRSYEALEIPRSP